MQFLLVLLTILIGSVLFPIALSEPQSENQNHEFGHWTMPRTEHGRPDFQGYWFFGSRTPLQRPSILGDKQTYTIEEVGELEQEMRERLARQDEPLDPNRGAPEKGGRIGQEADDTFLGHYIEPKLHPVNGNYRTSVIIDPPSGLIPRREGFLDYNAKIRAAGLNDTDGPEGQPLSGRCLIFGAAIPSLTPMMMNPNLQIVQTENYLMIMTEMIHDARIIRINREHFSHDYPRWMGDAVASWEGDTLVVHSKNFRPEQSSSRSIIISTEFEVIERYALVSENETEMRNTRDSIFDR
ncbi:MAG: hypothetical protein CMQ41_13935, partial [Gammaproteobacteria bacterium]|nr:hypothetical protein [Gammaproteobacteria bacterium]